MARRYLSHTFDMTASRKRQAGPGKRNNIKNNNNLFLSALAPCRSLVAFARSAIARTYRSATAAKTKQHKHSTIGITCT